MQSVVVDIDDHTPQGGGGGAAPSASGKEGANEEAKKAGEQGSDCHDVAIEHWINGITPRAIANPMSVYPKYAGARTSWGINALGSCVVAVSETPQPATVTGNPSTSNPPPSSERVGVLSAQLMGRERRTSAKSKSSVVRSN